MTGSWDVRKVKRWNDRKVKRWNDRKLGCQKARKP